MVADDDEPPDDLKVDNPLPGVSVPFNPDDFASGPSNHTNRAARSQTLEQSQVPPEVQFPTPNMPMYDAVWGKLYLGFVACMFATSLLVWLKTSVPTSVPLGDTMYTLLKKSAPYLFWETLLAVAISAGWVFVMKRNSTALFYVSIVSVPFVLLGLFLYPLIMSYRSGYGGNTSQDKMMRWTSLIPLVLAGLWINFIYKGRKAINRSLGIIQLACKILADFPPLLLFNCAVVGVFIVATWIWFGMFARVFLRGHTVLSGGIVSWGSRSADMGAWRFLYNDVYVVVGGAVRHSARHNVWRSPTVVLSPSCISPAYTIRGHVCIVPVLNWNTLWYHLLFVPGAAACTCAVVHLASQSRWICSDVHLPSCACISHLSDQPACPDKRGYYLTGAC